MYAGLVSLAAANFNTNAVANTASTHIVIAPPGVGRRLRIRSIALNLPQNEPAANIFRIVMQDSTVAVSYFGWVLAIPSAGYAILDLQAPGITLQDNGGLNLISLCTAVVRNFNVSVVHYTI